jgi:hypothetical protein
MTDTEVYLPKPYGARDEHFLSQEWFKGVLKTRENDVRAHKIALTYSKLAEVLDVYIHGEPLDGIIPDDKRPKKPRNANWFHFGTWAALTVTRNITNQRPPQRVDTLPVAALRRWLTPTIIQARASNGQRVNRALAGGQRTIFGSVCVSLRKFLHEADKARANGEALDPKTFTLFKNSHTEATIVQLCAPRDRRVQREHHLPMLDEAFRFYIHASQAEDDQATRARCVLGGNLLLTAIEQELIDEAIQTVVDHIPQRIASAAEWRLARGMERWLDVPSQITALGLPFRYPNARAALDTAWSRLMTDQVFVIALPTETLRLGRDIPPQVPGNPYYPTPLRRLREIEIDDPPLRATLESIADLVEAFDRTVGDGRGSAARDWRRWEERMNWATTLLRSRQQDGTVYWPPFSLDDQRRILNDQLPLRSGDPSALEVQVPLPPFPDDDTEGG